MSLSGWTLEKQQIRQAETLLSRFPPNIMQQIRAIEENAERRRIADQLIGGLQPNSKTASAPGQVIEEMKRMISESKRIERAELLHAKHSALAEAERIAEEILAYQRSAEERQNYLGASIKKWRESLELKCEPIEIAKPSITVIVINLHERQEENA